MPSEHDPNERHEHYHVLEHGRAISYGPGNPPDEEWQMHLVTEEGSVMLHFGEQAMYELWTEVKGVPWPEADSDAAEALRQLDEIERALEDEELGEAYEGLKGLESLIGHRLGKYE